MDIKKLMSQAKKMQEDILKTQEEMKNNSYTSEAGNGIVKIEIMGNKEVTKIEVDEKYEVIDKEDVEILTEMIMIAVNNGIKHIEEKNNKEMNKHTKGLGGFL